jgi:S-DNA-T family DNA segregation ATPase FtsK/SpoIIIE
MAKAKKKRNASTMKRVLDDERLPRMTGLVLVLVSLYLVIAFTSYLFSWKIDQDKVFRFSWSLLFTSGVEISNSLGRLGAILSHTFFYNLFGVTSYLVVANTFTTGVNLALGKKLFPLKRIYGISFFFLIWGATASGYFTSGAAFPWGGAVGSSIDMWLTAFLGNAGSAILLGFSLLGFSVITFNLKFKLPEFQKKETTTDDGFDTVTEDLVIEATEAVEEVKLETEPEPETEEYAPIDLNAEVPEEKEAPPAEGDISLEVEETEEEAIAEQGSLETNYDPTLDLPKYKYPPLDLLEEYGKEKVEVDKKELEANKNQIIETLNNYNIKISGIKATIGPTVTLYEIVPAPGVRISKIKNLEDDIALSLSALGIRIIAPIPGKGTVGIEVPNVKKEIVSMKTLLASEKFANSGMDLPVALGKTIANEIFVADLAKMPHLLMAGATGQGKSVGLNAILTSLLYKKHPSQLKFVLIDPKKVEMSLYKHIEKHFLAKLPDSEDAIITDTKKVISTLNALVIEMEDRYNLLKEAHVRNIKEYNQKFVDRKLNPEKGHRFLPYFVLVIDEFADLMMTAGKEIETPIGRLAQMARAVGIHLVIATQRPSVNVITGVIKANFPARIAFKVSSSTDSRTILDSKGAEQLIGRGDMLVSLGSDIVRLQCPFVDTPEVEDVTEFIGEQKGYPDVYLLPEYIDESAQAGGAVDLDAKDDMFEDAAHIVVQHQQGSTSLLQRRLKLGYNRAGRIIDQLEAAKIVGPPEGSKAREVLITDAVQLEQYLQDLKESK